MTGNLPNDFEQALDNNSDEVTEFFDAVKT